MRINKIKLIDFMSHQHSTFDIPDTGVVLITGANGAGKSSIVEAVSWGLWGKTIRGSTPKGCSVVVETPRLRVNRRRKKKSVSKLDWEFTDGTPNVEYDSTTKTQAGLEEQVGDHNIWRRTSVFSSADAAHFTLATDSERKRLLEAILGLDKFDQASSQCRNDLRAAERRLTGLEEALRGAEYQARTSEENCKSLEAAVAALEEMAPPEDCAEQIALLKEKHTELKEMKRDLSKSNAEIGKRNISLEYRVRSLEDRIKDLSQDHCGLCKQPLPEGEQRQAQRDELEAELEKARAAPRGQLLTAQMLKIEEEIQEVVSEGRRLLEAQKNYEKNEKTREQTRESLAWNQKCLANASAEIVELEDSIQKAQKEVSELKVCDRVLGLKGVRAHILGRCLSGIEDVANGILSGAPTENGPLEIRLLATTAKKTGGISDSISIELQGAGGEDGYKGASGGERRRVDVAILLALMEVATATYGREPGTLFFDEVFDSLDPAGVSSVVETLEMLSQDRAVVVISHSEDLIKELDPAAHYHVTQGKLEKR